MAATRQLQQHLATYLSVPIYGCYCCHNRHCRFDLSRVKLPVLQVMIGASEVGSVVPPVKEGQTVKKVRPACMPVTKVRLVAHSLHSCTLQQGTRRRSLQHWPKPVLMPR
jgi:hypothetical protein